MVTDREFLLPRRRKLAPLAECPAQYDRRPRLGHLQCHANERLDTRGGYVMQFGRWTVHDKVDAVLYEGLTGKVRRFWIDVALQPINGRHGERGVAANLIACYQVVFTIKAADPAECAGIGREAGQAVSGPEC